MSWHGKSRFGAAAAPSRVKSSGPANPAPTPSSPNARHSNGFKEFLWHLSDVRGGRLLDMGPVSPATINFLVNRGYGLATADFLRSWKEFLRGEEERIRQMPVGEEEERASPEALADQFLAQAMQFPAGHFDGILAWDVFDFLDRALMSRLAERMYQILKSSGAVLAVFHSRPAERFHNYRILDHETIELVPTSPLAIQTRVLQNREILDLLAQFRSSKTFIGRDNLREALFVK